MRWYGLMIILGIWPLLAWAEPEVTVNHEYYNIHGTTLEQIVREKHARGPKWVDGRRYGASTRPAIGWEFVYRETSEGCELESVQTHVDILFTMPLWVDKASAPKWLQRKWDKYYTALEEHENWHMKLAVRSAQLIEDTFLELKPRSSCTMLQVVAETKGKEILKASQKAQIKLDKETEHGRTQGAVLE